MISTPLVFPLTYGTGTYIFMLECKDQNGAITRDDIPYANLAFSPRAALDISSLVPSIAGLAFDYLSQLWIWTGYNLVPIALRHNAYVWDAGSRSVYLTDPFDQVRVT